jgi:hypothetical protein
MTGCPESGGSCSGGGIRPRQRRDVYVVADRSLVEPFGRFSDRRDLRQRAWNADVSWWWIPPAHTKIAEEILALPQRVTFTATVVCRLPVRRPHGGNSGKGQ